MEITKLQSCLSPKRWFENYSLIVPLYLHIIYYSFTMKVRYNNYRYAHSTHIILFNNKIIVLQKIVMLSASMLCYIVNLSFITKLVLFINSVLRVEHTVNVILSHIFSWCMSKDHSFYEMYDRRIIHFMGGFLVDDCTNGFYGWMTFRSSILFNYLHYFLAC